MHCLIVLPLHGNIIHIVIVSSLILLLSPYRPSNQNNMDIDNNIIDNLLGLGKLMEEIVSVFWVDLGYRLHS